MQTKKRDAACAQRQYRVGGATVQVQEATPALLLRVETPLLAHSRTPESRTAVGLVFPQMGSEQIVLLPDSGTGVRVVELGATEGDTYLVEVYPPRWRTAGAAC